MSEKKPSLILVPLRTPCARTLNTLGNGFLVVILLACIISLVREIDTSDLSALIASGAKLIPWLFGMLVCYLVKGFAVIVEWYGLCIHANQK